MNTNTEDMARKKAAADAFGAALEKYEEGVQKAIIYTLANLAEGCSWAFLKKDQKTEKNVQVLRKTNGVYVAELSRAYLVFVPFDKLMAAVQPISSGYFNESMFIEAQERYKKGVLALQKFFSKGREGLVGIFSLNESPTITISGKPHPAFSVDIGTMMEGMDMYGYSFVVDGRLVTLNEVRAGSFEDILRRCEVAPSGNALMITVKKN